MKTKLLVTLAVLSSILLAQPAFSAETTGVSAEAKDVVMKVQAKLQSGKTTEQDLAPEIKALEDILVAHKSEKTEEVAQVVLVKARLYMLVDNLDKAKETVQSLKTSFPETVVGKNADTILAQLERQAQAKKIQAALVVGAPFPDFSEKDLAGKPLSIASFKGKVVLVDFWATWCGPCIAELPNVLKAYEKYHSQGFEIIGVSLDSDRSKLDTFLEQNKMPWPQFFDGQAWQTKLAVQYGINSIPATFLLDGQGKIIGRDLRGEQLEAAVAAALKKK